MMKFIYALEQGINHHVTKPDDVQQRLCAILDAAADERGSVYVAGVGLRTVCVPPDQPAYVMYYI